MAFKYLIFASLLAALPLAATGQDAGVGEPEVTIRQDGDQVVEEYRINGFLYAIKITPENGPPYFLVRADGDDNFVRTDQPDMLIPAWEIFSW